MFIMLLVLGILHQRMVSCGGPLSWITIIIIIQYNLDLFKVFFFYGKSPSKDH